jgi:hypothetical protein
MPTPTLTLAILYRPGLLNSCISGCPAGVVQALVWAEKFGAQQHTILPSASEGNTEHKTERWPEQACGTLMREESGVMP